MNRTQVLQAIIERIQAKTYLEIGLGSGRSFHAVQIPRKLGIDPVLPRLTTRLKGRLRALGKGATIRYFRMTSDIFFGGHPHVVDRQPFDVALVDGAHTYRIPAPPRGLVWRMIGCRGIEEE